MTTADRHLWRTRDGGLVLDGDPAGAVLAYAPGDEIAKGDADKLPAEGKAKAAPANKARAKADNK